MSTSQMNKIIDHTLKTDVYAIYLRKSRADLEAENSVKEKHMLDTEKYQKN